MINNNKNFTWQFINFGEEKDDGYIKGGDMVTIKHIESSSFLSGDIDLSIGMNNVFLRKNESEHL